MLKSEAPPACPESLPALVWKWTKFWGKSMPQSIYWYITIYIPTFSKTHPSERAQAPTCGLDPLIWPGDLTRWPDLVTWPGDLTRWPDSVTWPVNSTRWPGPLTWPGNLTEWPYRDLTRWPDPVTWPGDLTRWPDPVRWLAALRECRYDGCRWSGGAPLPRWPLRSRAGQQPARQAANRHHQARDQLCSRHKARNGHRWDDEATCSETVSPLGALKVWKKEEPTPKSFRLSLSIWKTVALLEEVIGFFDHIHADIW